MDNRIVIGMASGALCGTFVILAAKSVASSTFFGILFWVSLLLGVIVAHFGQHTIKNTRGLVVSIVSASVVKSFSVTALVLIVLSDEFSLSDPYFMISFFGGIFFSISLFSFFSAKWYAIHVLRLPGRRIPVSVQCPHCRNTIEKTWDFCAFCGEDLRRVSDDKTRIYEVR
jgi:hypothetical protein